MADNRGTDPREGCSEWFSLEAECSDLDDDLEKLLEETNSDVSELLDDGDAVDNAYEQGLSRALFRQQENEEYEQQMQDLKRKYISPLQQLSPRLEAISLSPQHKCKKRLFLEQDSGLELSVPNESEDTTSQVEVPPNVGEGAQTGVQASNEHYRELLRCSNIRAILLSKFKNSFGVGFMELCRKYNSNKTCCRDWVVTVYGVKEELLEASKQLLQQHCGYIWLHTLCPMSLYLLCFNTGKSRDTVERLLCTMLDVHKEQILTEPPKLKSVMAALYWYKESMNSNVYAFGEYPEWVVSQTMITHHESNNLQFELSPMIQWAFDNDYIEESVIAYHYAKLADEDINARAFLAHNSQAKIVRDCAWMVRHYKRGEMREMSMSKWIYYKLKSIDNGGHWSQIVKFVRYQGINFILFLDAFKKFLLSKSKKNCILIYGPSDCGKTMFCMSLIKALQGRVISFANAKSQFWLQPLTECKIAMLDDATEACWNYLDMYLRNGLDGNWVSIDCKHKAPMQIKFPPLLITSNYDILKNEKYRFLLSRIEVFEFKHTFPFNDDGSPMFEINDQSWKSFFQRLWQQLDLSDQEDEGEDGGSQPAFQCTTRPAHGHL
ncbi:E1 [Betapapillomavirus 5]|uniref:Replication protein E1 n=1 Tax=Betapapillomavirus 5 TaxID=334209 RepID=A0A2D2AL18_9PAPI|nr:E1 [Betapapillomavirus 5]